MNNTLRSHVAAALLLVPTAAVMVANPAVAQQRATVALPAITSMAFNSNEGLAPGARLRLQVQASPGARTASVALGNSGIVVPLEETSRGNYVGTHVVRRADRIDPTERMTIRAQYGQRVIAATVAYPPAFQALASGGQASPRPEIERFVMRPAGNIRPGQELRFRLVGEPGANAWLNIPGVARRVELQEQRPGVYVGSYTVRRGDNLNAFERSVATLEKGNRRDTERVTVRGGRDDDDNQARDTVAPVVSDLSPANGGRVGERGRVHISARVTDAGSGIDTKSVRLRIDGKDVSERARLRGDTVHFRDNLAPGRHTAELLVRDEAGNTTRQAWNFRVVDRDQRAGRDLTLEVTSHRDNAVVDGDGRLVIEGRTLPGATVRVQVDSVTSLAGIIGFTQPVADQSVQADDRGRFSVRVAPRGLPIPGTRYEVELTATRGTQTAEETLTLYQRQG
jgi:hypothetical protein